MLINAAVGKKLEQYGIRPMYTALVIGSFMPDIPLTLLSVGFIGWHGLGGGALTASDAANIAFYDYFYNDPFWVSAHHLFHAPLLILLWLAVGWWFGVRGGRTWGMWLFWFAVGNALHTALDIPTHHNDGPLLLFPLNWELRFASPVSYWDPNAYGIPFTILELTIDLMLSIFFFKAWRKRRQSRAMQYDAHPHSPSLS